MTKFSILILGSASASPTLNRNPSSQLININEHYYLIDCGEGTQYRLRANKIKFQRINHIFISHLHGDHYLGLPGLLQTMSLLGRTLPLNLYGPKQLKELLDLSFAYSHSSLKFPLIFHETQAESSSILFEDEHLSISTIILDHRIPCTGFLFKEKFKNRKINPFALEEYKIPVYAIESLKRGEDFVSPDNERIIKNELLTLSADECYSYAYCSDTKFNEKIIPQIKDVNILYHEATFINKDIKRAEETFHSTAEQAAIIAKKSNAKLLIIGHFSNRYSDLNVVLNEAKQVFENTKLGIDDSIFELP